MKKHARLSVIGLFCWVCGQGQGLQPNLMHVYANSENDSHSSLQMMANNHHKQSNINDLFLGYRKYLKKLSLWSIGGIKKHSLIQTKQLQAGSQIQLGQFTHISQELIVLHERFPENNIRKQWQSNLRFEYQHTKFKFQYLHHWNWSNNNLSADLSPNHSFKVVLNSSAKHQLQLVLWQFTSIPSQFLLQHRLVLNRQWEIAWGIQWPNTKYWIVLKNKRHKLQSNICLITQPYFLPSLSQLYEIDMD
jgi:hypothetical protein